MPKTKNFAEYLRNRLENEPTLAEEVKEECLKLDIASQILQAREEAKLSQAELARRIGSSQSVIARLEQADYDGHTTKVLQRIAFALGLNLKVEFYKEPKLARKEEESPRAFTKHINWETSPRPNARQWDADLQVKTASD